jgi:hypothetical protein
MKTDAAGSLTNYTDPDSSQDPQSLDPASKASNPEIKPGGNSFENGRKTNPWQNAGQALNGPSPLPKPTLPEAVEPLQSTSNPATPTPTQTPPGVPVPNSNLSHTMDADGTSTLWQPLNPGAKPGAVNDSIASNVFKLQQGGIHLLRNDWNIGSQGDSLDNIHFPMKIDASAKADIDGQRYPGGNFFFQHFGFTDTNGRPIPSGVSYDPSRQNYNPDLVGYIGLEPNKDGTANVKFAAFGKGVTFDPNDPPDPNRVSYNYADSEEGSSQHLKIDFEYGHKYDLSVEVDENDPRKIHGYVQDITDPNNPGPKRLVGTLVFEQPVKFGNKGAGIVEQHDSDITESDEVHHTKGTFYEPFTNDHDGQKKATGFSTNWTSETSRNRGLKDNITGFVGNSLNPKTGERGSSFDVHGAGWKPGTSIPGINTSDEVAENEPSGQQYPAYDENHTYQPGQGVTYKGGIYVKTTDGESDASPDGHALPGFSYVAPAPSTPPNGQGGSTGAPQSPQTPNHPTYDDDKHYQPGDTVKFHGSLFVKSPGGSTKASPDGYSIPGFSYNGPASSQNRSR